MRGRMGPGPGVQISPQDSGWHRGGAAGRLRRHCVHGVVSARAGPVFPSPAMPLTLRSIFHRSSGSGIARLRVMCEEGREVWLREPDT